MLINWKYAESTDRPLDVDEVSSPTSVYLAKDIAEKQKEDTDGETVTYYEYQSAVLSKAEYNMYLTEKLQSDVDFLAMMTDVDMEET